MNTQIIYKRNECYASFPHIAINREGDLLLVFREAGPETANAALQGTHTHQDPDSRILFTQSTDGGERWSKPVNIYEGEYAVNDPAITVLHDGSYLVRYCRWQLAPNRQRHLLAGPVMRHYVRAGAVGTMAGNGFICSQNRGDTWFPISSEVVDASLARAMSREATLELPDQTLLLPVYDGYPFHSECAWLLRSWDGGHHWGDASLIAGHTNPVRKYRETVNFNETALLSLDETTLLAVVRADGGFTTGEGTFISEGGLGELAWTISNDAGLTWEPLQRTGLWGQPAHLLRLADGCLLCTYGHRRKPYGIRAALFTIENNKWKTTHEITLHEDGPGWDIGYPASVQVPNGDIFSVYYFYHEDGVRHIAGTRWSCGEMKETEEEA